MTPVDFGTIVTTAFGDFADNLVDASPALLAIGIVTFGVPFVWNWAKRLVS